MPSLNICHLIGNLTRDPESRITPQGTAFCQFGLAISRSFKDGSGQSREEVTFVDIEAWGKQGEIIAKHCTKGRPLYVQGRLKLDQWEDKQSGDKRSKLKVVLENFQFIGGRESASQGSQGSQADAPDDADQTKLKPTPRSTTRRGRTSQPPPPQQDINDEDIPF